MPIPSRQTMPRPAVPTAPRSGGTSPLQGNVLDRITQMEFDPDEGMNFLFYGESRTGKTTLWSSFPGPILALICSGGQKPGELRSINTTALRAKIDTVTLTAPSEMDEIVRAIETGNLKHRSGKPYSTIVLDHVSGFQDLKLMLYKNLTVIPQQKSFGIATRQDWGEIASQIKEHLTKLLSLRCHVVIIAQERIFFPGGDEDKPEKKSIMADIALSDILKPKVGAALIPSLTGWLQPAVDYGVQTYIRPRIIEQVSETKAGGKIIKETVKVRGEGYEYCGRLAVHEIFYTKFRIAGGPALPEAIILGDSLTGVRKNPSGYDQLMKVINGGDR